jgi:predicted HTH domain antitoxin
VDKVNINIEVPQEILLTLREKEYDLALDMKRWTALKLYADKKLTIGQCAELAEMNEEDFVKYLGANKISIFAFDSLEDLKEDIINA